MRRLLKSILIVLFACALFSPRASFAQDKKTWHIILSKSRQQDIAIKLAFEDLHMTGDKFGVQFKIKPNGKTLSPNTILVGSEVLGLMPPWMGAK